MKKLAIPLIFNLVLFGLISCSNGTNSTNQNETDLTFEVGDIVTINGEPQGIVFHVDEASGRTSGKILCRERHQTKFCGLYTKACNSEYGFQLVNNSSKTDGQANWELWKQILPDFEGSSYYDAWYWCKYIKGQDWYIPAKNELIEINQNLSKINETTDWLSLHGYFTNLFDETRTWSSTPRSLNTDVNPYRLAIWAGSGTVSMLCNEDKYCVQPVRVFNKNTPGLGKIQTSQNSSTSTSSNNNPTTNYIGTKAPGAKKAVGDIVFNDGSATPYSIFKNYSQETIDTKKASAIAVIFYAGTKDTDIFEDKTLGVGLHPIVFDSDANTWVKWCTSNAKANKKKISTIYCRPDDDSTRADKATFLKATDLDGSDNLLQIADFLGTEDDTSGDDISQRYPAFYYTKNYKDLSYSGVKNTAFEDGWYLPSCAELCYVYRAYAIIKNVTSLCNSVTFQTGIYWSSSQAGNSDEAVCVNFADGTWPGYKKSGNNSNFACAIRVFN